MKHKTISFGTQKAQKYAKKTNHKRNLAHDYKNYLQRCIFCAKYKNYD